MVFALKFILDLDCQPMYKYTSLGTIIMQPGLADGVRDRHLKTSVFGHLSFLLLCLHCPGPVRGCVASPPALQLLTDALGARPEASAPQASTCEDGRGYPHPAPPREVPATVCFPHEGPLLLGISMARPGQAEHMFPELQTPRLWFGSQTCPQRVI